MSWKCSLLLGFAIVGSLTAQELKPAEIYQRLLPSIMTLEVENRAGERFVGTAFLAITNGIGVTAWHVVADACKVRARFSDTEFVDVLGLVDKDEKNDLALFRLPISARPQAQLNASNSPVGSRVYALGAPKGYDFSITDGLVSQMRHVRGVREYQVSCPISPGNSGGPVVNEYGQVIGVTSWTKVDAQNLNFATPASFLFSLNPALIPKMWGAPGKAVSAPGENVRAQSTDTADSNGSENSGRASTRR